MFESLNRCGNIPFLVQYIKWSRDIESIIIYIYELAPMVADGGILELWHCMFRQLPAMPPFSQVGSPTGREQAACTSHWWQSTGPPRQPIEKISQGIHTIQLSIWYASVSRMAFRAICSDEPLSFGNVSQGSHHHIDARPGLGSMSGICCSAMRKNSTRCCATVVLIKSDNGGKLQNPQPRMLISCIGRIGTILLYVFELRPQAIGPSCPVESQTSWA